MRINGKIKKNQWAAPRRGKGMENEKGLGLRVEAVARGGRCKKAANCFSSLHRKTDTSETGRQSQAALRTGREGKLLRFVQTTGTKNGGSQMIFRSLRKSVWVLQKNLKKEEGATAQFR